MLAAPAVLAEEPASFFEDAETQKFGKITRTYDSPTLKYTVDKFLLDREIAYLTRVWVQDPVRQIRKATSSWKQNVKQPEKLIAKMYENKGVNAEAKKYYRLAEKHETELRTGKRTPEGKR